MSDFHTWTLVILGLLIFVSGVTFFVMVQYALVKPGLARAVNNTPISPIGSAAQGYTAISGTAQLLMPTAEVTPIKNHSCLWYSFRVIEKDHQRTGDHVDDVSIVIYSDWSTAPFKLKDKTGECIIFPEHAAFLGVTEINDDIADFKVLEAIPGIPADVLQSAKASFLTSKNYRFELKYLTQDIDTICFGQFKTTENEGQLADQLQNQDVSLNYPCNSMSCQSFDRNYPYLISAEPIEKLKRRYSSRLTSLLLSLVIPAVICLASLFYLIKFLRMWIS